MTNGPIALALLCAQTFQTSLRALALHAQRIGRVFTAVSSLAELAGRRSKTHPGLGKVVALILTKPRTEEATSEQEGGEVEQTEIRAAS